MKIKKSIHLNWISCYFSKALIIILLTKIMIFCKIKMKIIKLKTVNNYNNRKLKWVHSKISWKYFMKIMGIKKLKINSKSKNNNY